MSWADALVAMAEASLATEAIARPHYDRHLVVVHVGTDDTGQANGHLHLGPALPDSLRRFMTCDAKARVQHDDTAKPLSVGRSARIVANRTRLAIEERDAGCRVPGCDRSSGCTCTTWCTGKTAGPPTPRTSSIISTSPRAGTGRKGEPCPRKSGDGRNNLAEPLTRRERECVRYAHGEGEHLDA